MSEKHEQQSPGEAEERLLETIRGPADLHELNEEQLVQVAQEMRTYIIDTIGVCRPPA